MSRRRTAPATPGADWQPHYGFCKGLLSGHHPYNHEKAKLTYIENGGGMVAELQCRNCKLERRTLFVRGKKHKHTYHPPPGYIQPTGKKGVTEERTKVREAYFAYKLRGK